jgi:hypothetical protein
MVFLNPGETSAQNDIQQGSQQLLTLLLELLKRLQDLSLENQQVAEGRGEPPTPQEMNEALANASGSLLEVYGQQITTESGDLTHACTCGNFEIRGDLTDGTGYPVHHVYSLTTGEELLSFQQTPSGKFAFFETERTLSPEHQQFMLKQLTEGVRCIVEGVELPSSRQGLESVDAQLKLGEQAPKGTRAISLTAIALDGADYKEWNRYAAARGEDGSLTLSDQGTGKLLAYMTATGQVNGAGLSAEHQFHLQNAYAQYDQAVKVYQASQSTGAVAAQPAAKAKCASGMERSWTMD